MEPLGAGLPSLYRVTTLLGPRATAALAREAYVRHADAQLSRVVHHSAPPPHDPSRWFETSVGGPALRAFYTAPAVLNALRTVTGSGWRPSGEDGSYSYYRREGHFLGIHLDVDECKLALITCFHEEGAPSEGQSGALELWPERVGEPLAAIEADPEPGRVTVRLRPGESIVLLGGLAPHRFTATGPGHVRITAPLCYLPGVARPGIAPAHPFSSLVRSRSNTAHPPESPGRASGVIGHLPHAQPTRCVR